jgi:hypothetical protein
MAKLSAGCLWLIPEPYVEYKEEVRHLILAAIRNEEIVSIFSAFELTEEKFINFSALRSALASLRDSSGMPIHLRVEGGSMALVIKTMGEVVMFDVVTTKLATEDLIVNGVQMHFDIVRLQQAYRANPDAVLQRIR